MSGQFSANASALGYFYQARYALLLILQAKSDAEMSLESLDDIAFEKGGTAVELLQTKHHIDSTASLTNASSDLWKTLRVWCTAVLNNAIKPDEVVLTLVSTGRAPDGSVASKLRPEISQGRDVDTALKTLRTTAQTSSSHVNAPAYAAFLSLSKQQQQKLINSVRVLDSSPTILDARDRILEQIKFATRPLFLEAVYERLEGWWFNRVVKHLSQSSIGTILFSEVMAQFNDIQEQFHQDNLPIDFFDAVVPEESQLSQDERIFIEQLRLVSVGKPRIRKAINDYYRAFQQRSKWVREDLLLVGDLDSYEKHLIDEWERRFEMMREDLGDEGAEDLKQREGRALFNWIDGQELHIRPRCTEPYVMRGSYHMLSNKLMVGWHADFIDRLQHLLSRTLRDGA